MAYSRRSLTSNFTLLTQRLCPSFAPLLHHHRRGDDDRSDPQPSPSQTTFHSQTHAHSQPLQEFHNTSAGFGALVRERRGFGFSLPLALGSPVSSRYSSAAGGGSKDFEFLNDVADVLTEKSVDVTAVVTQAAPVAGEVAAAAADSAIPVAALQYLIGGVHSFTGLDWWVAIALTTLLIRTGTIPLLLHQIKTTSKLSLMRPHLEEIKEKMQNSMDPQVVEEGQRQMKKLFKQYGVSPFTPLKGLFIQGPIFVSFFLAISNMAEKVPSFNSGGAFWFTDLTTPDPLYLLPVLTSLTFLATVELNMQEGMEGNPMAGKMKNFFRVLALMTVPFTASFPKAIFSYWITSNLFSLVYGLVLKHPPVRKFLNLPEMGSQASTEPQPVGLGTFGESSKQSTPASSSSALPMGLSERRVSSSSVISQRIRNLEKSVKGRKKLKKR